MSNFFRRLFSRQAKTTSRDEQSPTLTTPSAPLLATTLATPPDPTASVTLPPAPAVPLTGVAIPATPTVRYSPDASAATQPQPQVVRSLRTLPDPGPFQEPAAAAIRQRQAHDRQIFGEELWGVTAQQLTAPIDVTKLRRIGLPVFYSEADLADWLGLPLSRLHWYTYDRAADTSWHYRRHVVRKRSGGERVILAPRRELKALQRKVLDGIVALVPTAPAAHGFVPGRSTVTNARPHVGKNVVLKLDLKDFFPSITYPRVRGLFIALGYPFPVAAALALLCTEYDREPFDYEGQHYFVSVGPRHLVQGAPTSPGIANLIAWRLDRRLDGLARQRGFTYTRYADDLTFSGNDDAALTVLRLVAPRIIHDEHFQPHPAKTRIARQSARQIVTGLVVNDAVAVPRKERRRLRAILHNAGQTSLATQNRDSRKDFPAYLQGMIAYVNAASALHAAKLRASLDRVAHKE